MSKKVVAMIERWLLGCEEFGHLELELPYSSIRRRGYYLFHCPSLCSVYCGGNKEVTRMVTTIYSSKYLAGRSFKKNLWRSLFNLLFL